jgi:hypothetical protein
VLFGCAGYAVATSRRSVFGNEIGVLIVVASSLALDALPQQCRL